MKTVKQIYDEYKIMPNLQLHQLRVASVAKVICDNLQISVDTERVVLACLFHDMGNIIKSDLNRFPDFLEPEGLGYWQGVKDEFISKYGPEEHTAALAIAGEIGLSKEVIDCIHHVGFSNLGINEEGDSWENKICNYADMRVGPYGVLSFDDRLAEGNKRYAGTKHTVSSDRFESLAESGRQIEKQIFAKCAITPGDINDEKIQSAIEDLRNKII